MTIMSGFGWYPLIPSHSVPFLGSIINERRDRLDYDDRRFRERERDWREDDYRRDSGGNFRDCRFSLEPSYLSYLDEQRQGGWSDFVSYPLGHLGGSRSDHGNNNWNCNYQNRDCNNDNNNYNWSQGNRGGPLNQWPGILGAKPGYHAVPELPANPWQVPALGMTGGGLGSGLTAQLAQQQQQLMAMVQMQSLTAAMPAQANDNAQAQVQSQAKQGMHSSMGLLPAQLIPTKEELQEEKEDGAIQGTVQDDEETEGLNSTKEENHQDHGNAVSSPSEFNDRPLPKAAKPTRQSRTSRTSKGRQPKKNKYKIGRLVGKRLMFYYGKPNDIQLPDSLEFATQYPLEDGVPSKALEIGCALGWSTFQLAKRFHQVVGIDCSPKFIKAANELKTDGKLAYPVQTKGSPERKLAKVPSDIDRSRVSFRQGDACNLPSDLGQFGCVLAENVVCCLQNVDKFLDRLPSLVAPGGILVITSPKPEFDTLKRCLGQNFELIEDKPVDQENTHHTTIWKRRQSS